MKHKHDTLLVHEPTLLNNVLTCRYEKSSHIYENKYHFPEQTTELPEYISRKLSHWIALSGIFGMFSLHYFQNIKAEFALSHSECEFFERLIFSGLAEFRAVNRIPLSTYTQIAAPRETPRAQHTGHSQTRLSKAMLLNGGGKDGSVSAYLLNSMGIPFAWFQRGSSLAQQNVVSSWATLPVFKVERQLDIKRKDGPYSGHRPMSAIIALLAVFTAARAGYSAVIASNEASANEENYIKDGVKVNHQYSKSLEFERYLQQLLKNYQVPVDYFSLLRPLHELQIGFLATNLSSQQLSAITSCNNGTKTATWCLECHKCAFVVLVMTAASPEAATQVWHSQQINNPDLVPYLEVLLDPRKQKPFECVGTLEESQLAAKIITKRKDSYLTLTTRKLLEKYSGHITDKVLDHHLIRSYGEHAIPKEYFRVTKVMQELIDTWAKTNVSQL